MEEQIQRLLRNYINAKQSWEAWIYMYSSGPLNLNTMRPDYEGSIQKKVDENVLLSHLRYLAWKDYHIEIYKVIKDSKNSTDNIFLILREFSKLRPHLKNQIDGNLEELENLKPEIKKLTDLRDKFYAHLDADYLNYGGQGGIDHYLNIFKSVEKAIITLTSKSGLETLLRESPFNQFNLD